MEEIRETVVWSTCSWWGFNPPILLLFSNFHCPVLIWKRNVQLTRRRCLHVSNDDFTTNTEQLYSKYTKPSQSIGKQRDQNDRSITVQPFHISHWQRTYKSLILSQRDCKKRPLAMSSRQFSQINCFENIEMCSNNVLITIRMCKSLQVNGFKPHNLEGNNVNGSEKLTNL